MIDIGRMTSIALALVSVAWGGGCTVQRVPAEPLPEAEPPPEFGPAEGEPEPVVEGPDEPGGPDQVEEADEDPVDEGPVDDVPAAGGVAVKAPRGLQEAPPASCSGSRDIRLVGRSITTDLNAVEVSGSCDVLIERSHIRAGAVAIMVSGSGDVIVRDSVIEGGLAAVIISGSGEVRAERSRFIGRRDVSGSGELIDGGGNRWK